MSRDYKTIQEIAGPLMLIRGVEGVAYNELGEIELSDGTRRRCKVLEIDEGIRGAEINPDIACEEITNLIPHIRWLSEKAVLR